LPPLVSVVTLTYNRCQSVLELLEALSAQDYAHYEVILVDNNSADNTVEIVRSRYPDVKVLRCPQNFGMVSYNFGLANANGEYVIVIDDDGLPASPDWISQIVDRFESDPSLGAVACTIRMKDTGRIAYDSPQFIPEGDPARGFPTAAYNGTGAGLRMEALRQVGYYPFHFFRSWLELHLCTRLIEAGWQVRYFPSLEVWHCRPTGSVYRPVTYYGLRNYLWYVWTFYPWPYWIQETLHFLGSRLKLTWRRPASLRLLAKATIDAFLGWPRFASTRQPISSQTLNYLRRIRRHRNDYGLVPEYRRFPAPSPSNA